MEEVMDAVGSPMGDWTMDNKIEQHWKFAVKKVDKKGFSHHIGTLDRILINMDMGEQGVMVYDTKDDPRNDMHKHFSGLIGMEIKMVVNSAGDIIEVEGAEALQGHMFKKDAEYNGNHHLAETWNVFNVYPGKEIKAGETWNKKRIGTSFYPFEGDFMCLVADTPSVKGDVIMTNSFINPNPNSLPTNEMGMQIDYAMKGAASGFFQVNAELKRIVRGDIHWDMEGDCNMVLPDGKKTSFKVTLKRDYVLIYDVANN